MYVLNWSLQLHPCPNSQSMVYEFVLFGYKYYLNFIANFIICFITAGDGESCKEANILFCILLTILHHLKIVFVSHLFSTFWEIYCCGDQVSLVHFAGKSTVKVP